MSEKRVPRIHLFVETIYTPGEHPGSNGYFCELRDLEGALVDITVLRATHTEAHQAAHECAQAYAMEQGQEMVLHFRG